MDLCNCTFDPSPHVVGWCSPTAAAWLAFETKTLPRWAGRPVEMGS